MTRLQALALGIAGVTAFGIGAFVSIAPQDFYATYGIALGPDPSLLSELRAPGAGLAASGCIMLAGLVRRAMRSAAIAAALAVFLGFPAGRSLGIVLDGAPSSGILAALALELAIAALCLVAFRPRSSRSAAEAVAS